MRGNFDNSAEHLARLGPTLLSNDETAYRIARGLQVWTGKRWIVTLKVGGRGAGGFHVEPPKERLRNGFMAPQDWQHLVDVLGVFAFPRTLRYYILPDEVGHVLTVLEEKGPRPQRRSKLDRIEVRMRDEDEG